MYGCRFFSRHWFVVLACVAGTLAGTFSNPVKGERDISDLNDLRRDASSGWFQTTPIPNDESVILTLLKGQEDSWNNANIQGFMTAYWQSDQMSFAGGGRLTRGWQATLERYQRIYPPEKMGKLEFRNLEIRLIGDRAAMVLGNYHLTVDEEVKEGGFTLVLEKFEGDWKIIHDHTSALTPETKDD